jgi:nitrite reductase/ring-hydroxylating ferredoxin subunit
MFGSAVIINELVNKNQTQNLAESATREVEITFSDSLKEGEMRSLKVGDADGEKILISRYQGKLYATGNFCSHFGVPLEGGMLFDDKVLCPAHAAGFSVVSGEPELAPGLNGIPSFPVHERDGKFFV